MFVLLDNFFVLTAGSLLMESSVEIHRSKLLLKLFTLIVVYMSLCVSHNVVYGKIYTAHQKKTYHFFESTTLALLRGFL